MALTDFRIEEQDLSAGDLTLDARDGESLEIVARGIAGGADGQFVEEYVREELMLAYPIDEGNDEFVLLEHVEQQDTDVFGVMRDHGFRAPNIRVPEGQTYTLSNPDAAGSATVVYREQSPGAANESSPGGPGSKSRTFVSTGTATENVAAGGSGSVVVGTSRNPPQLPDWPFETDVSANFEYDLQGLMLGLDDGAGTDTSIASFKLTSGEVDFLSRNSASVSTSLAPFPNTALTTLPMMFDSEPTFSPGDELELTVDVANAGAGAQDAIVNAVMVFYRRAV